MLGFGMLALGDAPSFAAKATAEAAPPERGFVSLKPGNSWEEALISGNGRHGALVYGQPIDETIVLNHARLYPAPSAAASA